MCGIVGILGIPDAARIVRNGLKRLEYRGYDSAGVAWLDEAGVELVRAVGRVEDMPAIPANTSRLAVGHTRWATHGAVTEENAHPQLDGTGRFAVVHNGTLENFRSLRRGLEAEGHVFQSATDTEILAHRYERARRTEAPLEALRSTLGGLEGSWATVILDSDAEALAFARHRTPLVIGITSTGHMVASDVTALVEHTHDVIYLEDGDHGVIDAEALHLFDVNGDPKPVEPETVQFSLEEAERSGFTYFMEKEIHDAPVSLNQCIGSRIQHGPVDVDLGIPDELLENIGQIRIVACGTSHHAALMGRHFLENWAGIPVQVDLASDLRERPYLSGPGTLWIGVSQSGETLDTLEALRFVARKGGRVLAITNVQGSSLQRMAAATIHTRVGPEIGVAATKTLLGQVACLAMLAVQLGLQNQRLERRDAERIAAELDHMPRHLEAVLEADAEMERLGRRLAGHRDLFFLGRGIHVATALEAALKFKEITYQHAEGFGAGELKHGPFAMLSNDTPCVWFLPDDAALQKNASSLMEVQTREAPCMVISQLSQADADSTADVWVQVPACDPLLAVLPFSLAGQMIAYHAAVALGRNVDRPRNLAKSVTVE